VVSHPDPTPGGGHGEDPAGGPVGGPDRSPDRGRLRLTDPRTLLALATVGLVLGWSVRPLTRAWGWTTPTTSWLQVFGLLVATAVLASTVRHTRRALRRRSGELRPHEAVNRMVLGKACALVGALAAGGYAGSAISWLGALSQLSGEYMLRALLAAALCVGLSVAGLLLERACRIEDDADAS
jgi:cytochrome c biogenesis protein CcdA